MTVAAVVFDLDGVLVETEADWNAARRAVAERHGGRGPADAQRVMMGMSSTEWSRYMHDELGVALAPEEISDTVVAALSDRLRRELPLLPGAREAVTRLAGVWPLGLASSANRPVIELVLDLAGLADRFAVVLSSEEVPRGKPAPDVYLEAARRLGADPRRCVAVEDSTNGIRSAVGADMTVVAVPNRQFPPAPEAVASAGAVIGSVAELTPERVRAVAARAAGA